MAGEVRVDGQVQIKPATQVDEAALLTIDQKPAFVSRGGQKLAAALDQFNISPKGWICADVGASTGGFTDCLLQSGVEKVYAIDVGYGQLAWQLRQDQRVVAMERVNARHLESLPEQVGLIVMDVSFISVRLLLPVVKAWLKPHGNLILLVKPQFEAGKDQVGKGGIVRDREVHRQVLDSVIGSARSEKLYPRGLMPSPITGAKGNIEFLLWLTADSENQTIDVDSTIETVLELAHENITQNYEN